jgi:Na+/H+ antiporter NhaD/arsenite permease-like protein
MDARWPLAVAIFLLTYALIATRRLALLPVGRPAGALLGAVLMVATGVLTPEASFAAIDADTILLLFGMMLLSVYLGRAGLFERVAALLLRAARTPWRLLSAVSVVAALLSAVLVNDTVCLFLTPVVVATCARARLPMGPYLIALATSANIGSAATLVGNPQNMIIGSLSGVPFARFTALVGPAALVGLAANIALLWFAFGRRLPQAMPVESAPTPPERRPGTTLAAAVVCAIILCFFLGFHMGYTTLAGVMVFVLADRDDPRPTFAQVDWPLLVFFAGLFVVVGGLASTGIVEAARDVAAPLLDLRSASGLAGFTTAMTAGSNVFSNVPMVLLTGPELAAAGGGELGWALLGFTTTVAGNLTLLGSVANIIVAEGARDHYTLGFFEYLRFGLISTVVVLAVGVPVVVAMAG